MSLSVGLLTMADDSRRGALLASRVAPFWKWAQPLDSARGPKRSRKGKTAPLREKTQISGYSSVEANMFVLPAHESIEAFEPRRHEDTERTTMQGIVLCASVSLWFQPSAIRISAARHFSRAESREKAAMLSLITLIFLHVLPMLRG